MTQLEKQQKLEKQQNTIFKILWIPIILLLGVVPQIVRLEGVMLSEEVRQIIHQEVFGDFFSQYKATAIIGIIIVMVVLGFLLFQKSLFKNDKNLKIYGGLMLVFLALTFISAFISDHKDIAMWGYHDRAEGAIIFLCYACMLFYTVYVFRKVNDYKYILIALTVTVVLNTVIGAYQYIGQDLFMAGGALNKLVVPSKYSHLADSMQTLYTDKKVYGTLFHYNYMGSFVAIIIPLFATLALFMQGYKRKIACGLVAVCGALLLFGSSSRAAIIGISASVLVGIIMFGKVIIRKWKFILPVVAVIIVGIIGIGAVTGGAVFERIPTLINDAIGMFIPSQSDFDYKDELPIRDIVTKDGKTMVTMQKGTLTLSNNNGELKTVDENGKEVKYDVVDNMGTTADERFKDLQIKLVYNEGTQDVKGAFLVVNGIDCFILLIDTQNGVQLVDGYTNEPLELKDAPYWGFEGKEKLGSARGYIWSRTIPMLKDTMLVGNGPDTYALEFPQYDYMAKWWAYGTPSMIIDKPHNLYLQIWVGQGGIALLAFLGIILIYLIDCIKLYALKSSYGSGDILGLATMLGIVGYLGAGLFNDSVVSVAPIFWILLGAGIAINYITRKEQEEYRKKLEHATISMKTRKVV